MRTVSAPYLRSIVNTAENCGVDRDRLVDLLPDGAARLHNPATRYPTHLVPTLMDFSARESGLDDFGLRAGMNFRPATFLDVGYALTFAADIEEVMAINTRYQPLTQQLGQTRMRLGETNASIQWNPADQDAHASRRVTEAVFAGYATIGRWLLWEYAEPLASMRFRHSAPTGPALETYKTLFGAGLSFDAEIDEMQLDMKLVKRPLPNANPSLVLHLTKRLEQQLEHLKVESSIERDVLLCIQSQLSGQKPSLGRTAKLLAMSERSLRRRLASEGLSYKDLLERARREACDIYMLQPKIAIAELALLVGYADQGAFSRAFKEWHGEAPSVYRERLIGR